jgi:hypothetical protein
MLLRKSCNHEPVSAKYLIFRTHSTEVITANVEFSAPERMAAFGAQTFLLASQESQPVLRIRYV